MEDYNIYVDEFSKQYNKSKEETENIAIVKEVKTYLENKPIKIEPTKSTIDCGC